MPYVHLLIRAVVFYLCILALLRLGGKKQVGQMGTAEFVALLLISNAVQNSMNGGDNSLLGGIVLAAIIVALSCLMAYLTYRYKGLENFIQGHPRLLVYKGELVQANLDKEQISVRELHAILRRQGVHIIRDIHEAVLESDGYVSVIKTSELQRG